MHQHAKAPPIVVVLLLTAKKVLTIELEQAAISVRYRFAQCWCKPLGGASGDVEVVLMVVSSVRSVLVDEGVGEAFSEIDGMKSCL